MTELADLSAVDLLAAYRRRTLSPVEVTRAVLDRIAARDTNLCAMWLVDEAGAMAAARAAERRWQDGAPAGALDGVPITLKENIATAGVAMPLGTAANELVPAAADAPAAARVREAGAVILGKTTMPDYGMLSSGLSSFHRLARNPWDATRTPGGSSAGAGAAAAAGYGPLHLGTDIGGSVRLPAGWCGVAGFKPSFGRVPVDPPYYGRVIGPMARRVADCALLMSVIAAPDPRDFMSLPPAALDWQAPPRDLAGLRIGLLLEAGVGLPVAPEVREAVLAAAAAAAHAGAIVTPMAPFLTREMLDGLDRFWQVRAWAEISALPPARQARVLPFIRAWAERGAALSGVEAYRGASQMLAISAAASRACRDFDYVLSPTAPVPAFPAGLPCPTDDPERPFEHIGFTVGFNMSEQPALSLNCGMTASGLPIGLQIAGRRFDDIGVLGVAATLEALLPPLPAWPDGGGRA
jgi:aspartyl-tRNA(Asn)/glutamyl-tRNA(Gln) amidotransferase subunit A